jgi:SAM-dependent methyltransferase
VSGDRGVGGGEGAGGGGPGAAPRAFSCLWCGRTWQPGDADDLEARARLCPDCLGKAGENPFVRFRLRAGLEARAVTAAEEVAGARATHEDELLPYYEARAAEYDDWYLRRGRYAHGPVHDLAWQMELDAATTWLDGLPLRGEIVELAAGTGWWSALLATKGELHAYDAAAAPLDRARDRLLAHRLRAHLHVRDAWAAPDRAVDALFTGFWLSHVPRPRLGEFLATARAWLRSGGLFAAIDSLPDPASGTVDRLPPAGPDLSRRRLADGREFTIPKVLYTTEELRTALGEAGFVAVDVRTTGRFFLLASAAAPGPTP